MTPSLDSVGRRGPRRLGLAVLFSAAFVAGLAILYAFDPVTARFYPPCIFHSLTGLQCPGCGATRAVHNLLHGRVGEAFRLNALFVILAPLFAVGAALETWNIQRFGAPRLLTKRWLAVAAVVVALTWLVVRNLAGM